MFLHTGRKPGTSPGTKGKTVKARTRMLIPGKAPRSAGFCFGGKSRIPSMGLLLPRSSAEHTPGVAQGNEEDSQPPPATPSPWWKLPSFQRGARGQNHPKHQPGKEQVKGAEASNSRALPWGEAEGTGGLTKTPCVCHRDTSPLPRSVCDKLSRQGVHSEGGARDGNCCCLQSWKAKTSPPS